MRPDADSGEEVTLGVAFEIGGVDIFDAPFVNIAGGNEIRFNEFAKPGGGERVVFVVVGARSHAERRT